MATILLGQVGADEVFRGAQKLIQQKLKAWNQSSALLDDDGNELSFTLSDLKSAPATALRIGFKSDAILRGGVIPTQTSCVIRAPSITNGRWRNGALTLHVIDVTQPSAFAFKLQEPSDLKSVVNVDGKDITLVEDTNKDGTPDMRYGGVLADPASSTSGFVYESTLFWHYSGVCYSNAKWAEDAKNAIAAGTGDEKAGTTAASKLQAQLIKLENSRKQAIWELNHLIATTSDTKRIKEKQALIDKLTVEIDQIKLKLGINSGSGSGGTAPTVSATVDVSTIVAPVHGPNFVPGRRSWIDLIR